MPTKATVRNESLSPDQQNKAQVKLEKSDAYQAEMARRRALSNIFSTRRGTDQIITQGADGVVHKK